MKLRWIMYFAILHAEHSNIYGLKSYCSNGILDTCDGSKVSGDNICIDFGEIRFQCSCSISLNYGGQTFYDLASNPGYKSCGTAVEVLDSNNLKYRLPCSSNPDVLVLTNRSSFVKLIKEGIDGPTDYYLRVFTNDISRIINGSCGLSKSTSADTRLLQTSTLGRDQSTDGIVDKSTTTLGIQTVDNLTTEYFIFTSDVNAKGSTGKGLLIGLVTGGILVSVSTGVNICLVIYIVRFRKRKSTTKNEENEEENPEPVVTLTPSQSRPTSAYTTLNPGEANDPRDPRYTVPVHNRPASGYTTLNPDETYDPVEQQYTGLNLKIMPKVTEIKCSTRPNSTYTALNPEQELANAENVYSGLNNI
ncbi:uncharacterized protein LOC134230354 [Saccostrea cucullata]|uniref:uncharacterized protein LOC134230354 n=1 Tax=Saccostrea cuccullata TaxID=36930 RepID=UPI002ED5FA34